MDTIYLIIQNKNAIFNECSENNTIFVAFDNYKSYLYDNTDTLKTVLNTMDLYEIYNFIYNNYNFNFLYRSNDFKLQMSNILDEDTHFHSNSNENIINNGFLVSNKALKYLIDNKITFENEEENMIHILKKNNIFLNKKTKNAVIFFHKNIYKLYPEHWIELCKMSVLNQKDIEFDILEINYGGENVSIFKENEIINKKLYFYSVSLNTHTDAMTYLLNIGFNAFGYDIIYNTNLDDYYDEMRFYKQYKCIMDGYVLCSTLWHYIEEKNGKEEKGIVFKKETLGLYNSNNNYVDYNEIRNQLNQDHNVMNHSGVCFTKKVWQSYDNDWNLLRYRDDKPFEDLTFWQRIVNVNLLITIIDEDLIHYRIHSNQIGSNKEKQNDMVDSGFKKEPDKHKKRIGFYIKNDKENVDQLYEYINSINNLETEYKKNFYIITSFEFDNTQINAKNIYICNNYSKNITFFYPSIETQSDLLYYFYNNNDIYNFYNNLPTPDCPIKELKNVFYCGITHFFIKNFKS